MRNSSEQRLKIEQHCQSDRHLVSNHFSIYGGFFISILIIANIILNEIVVGVKSIFLKLSGILVILILQILLVD